MKKILLVMMVLCLFAGVASADLRVWYKFDEISGTNVMDSSGNDFHTTTNGSTIVWDSAGALGGCLNNTNTGKSMWIDVPGEVFATVDTAITVSWWAQRTPSTSGGGWFCGLNANNQVAVKAIPYKSGDDYYIPYNVGGKTEWWYPYSANSSAGAWDHFALVYDDIAGIKKLYFNGNVVSSPGIDAGDSIAGIKDFKLFTRTSTSKQDYWDSFKGKMDDFRIYDTALTQKAIAELGNGLFEKAKNPSPENKELIGVESLNDVNSLILEWDSGLFALSHDIYFGTDENNLIFQGSVYEESFSTGPLTSGTYYWRVDEVNDVDLWPGEVWSFTVFIPTIDDPILWYKFDETSGTDVMDSSDNDFHTATNGSTVVWDSEGVFGGCLNNTNTGQSMWVDVNDGVFATVDTAITVSWWAQRTPNTSGGGWFCGLNANNQVVVKAIPYKSGDDYYIPYNVGGETEWWYPYSANSSAGAWDHFALVYDEVAGIKSLYFNGSVVSSPGVDAGDSIAGIKDFKLFTRTSTSKQDYWDSFKGKMDDFRIYDRALAATEVDLLVGDIFKQAAKPSPADGAENVFLEGTVLTWIAGQGADAHDVYFSDKYFEVKNADTGSLCYRGQQGGTTFDPGTLNLFKTFYWRIDEVDSEGAVWKGDVWSFSSTPCIMIDDFESYDAEGNSIGAVWTDKYSYLDMDIMLNNPVEGGPVVSPVNSMRLTYHVPFDPYYSVAACTFSSAQDWTANDVKMLTIHCYGDADNLIELPAFVTIGDGTNNANVYVDVNTLTESWDEINVSLPAIELLGVDLSNVTYMEIGFGDGTDLGMSVSQKNTIYIDDIALYPSKCVLSESALQADFTGDCTVDHYDLAFIANNWLSEDELNTNFVDYSILANEWLVEDFWP